ncbi:MAG: hypothetical protein U5J78_04020 [Parasphingorhabdus sp.]|nr:hypothetical protein [Parasphingorhabdus sp.]
MENLRNIDGESPFGDADDAPEYVAFDDDDAEDVTPDAPPAIGQDERRMHVRAYNFWAGMLDNRKFPNVEDLAPETDQDFGPNSVLLDFTDGVENPAIQFLGSALREECGLNDDIRTLDDVPARSLLSRITDHYLQIIANEAPIGFEAEYVNQRGLNIMYRGILLPFSTDDDTIDFIYGVINWKECAPADLNEELTLEVEAAIAAGPRVQETGPAWADGPTSSPLSDGPADLAEDFAAVDVPSPTADDSLSDRLSIARLSAENALSCEQRGRSALYAAIGHAYDFYLMTLDQPADYAELLEDAGVTVQDRAPMTAVVKLIFGQDYDKTRLTEFASALRYADFIGVQPGGFADYLEKHQGGLKGVVAAERAARRPETKSNAEVAPRADVRERLRRAPVRSLAEIDAGDSEFVVLVARREGNGDLGLVGSLGNDSKLIEKVLGQVRV